MTSEEKTTALKEIAVLKSKRIFVEAEIEQLKDIIARNVNLYKNKIHAEERENAFNRLVELKFEEEQLNYKIWNKEKVFFK